MSSNYETPQTQAPHFSRAQGYALIGLLLVLTALVAWSLLKPAPRYAYKVISVQAQFGKDVAGGALDKKNASDLVATSVDIKDEQLSVLGNEGWELVGTFLELETTHPNYGSSEYVTGLQPNVRPQKAVLLFKKRL